MICSLIMENDFTELDVCLAKTTNPLTDITDELIDQLCCTTKAQPNGPYITLRFLAYKAQSPQIREALHALQILEQLVKRGGHEIAEEIGKFRFLNEIIKIVSPKYLAYRTSPCVRQKIVELIFLWSMEYKELPKIFEAYQMLKVQKIVSEDPVHVLENFRPLTPPLPRPKDEIFDDEKTVKTLKSLLDSGRPEQLETANLLIKNLALKAESRIQFKSTLNTELDSIQNCTQLLCDMLAQCNLNLKVDSVKKEIIYKGATNEDIELMRELFSSCEKSRLKLFKFANQIQDKDSEELNRLISVAEPLTSTINSCKRYFALLNNPKLISLFKNVNSIFCNDNIELRPDLTLVDSTEERLLDLNCSPPTSPSVLNFNTILNSNNAQMESIESSSSLIMNNSNGSNINLPSPINLSTSIDKSVKINKQANQTPKFKSAVEELDALSDLLIKQHLNKSDDDTNPKQMCLNQLKQQKSKTFETFIDQTHSTENDSSASKLTGKDHNEVALDNCDPSVCNELLENANVSDIMSNLFVPYDTIKPCQNVQSPLIVFEQNGLMITLHFTSNRPHKQILVFLLTFANYNPVSVSNIQFLAAVPKNMKVKLQSQTATSLPPLEPTHKIPEHFFTQLMLLGFNEPNWEQLIGFKFRLKYKLSYSMQDIPYEHVSYFDWNFSNDKSDI